MQIKRVKITGAAQSSYWYADKVGDEFHVTEVGFRSDIWRNLVVFTGAFESRPPASYLTDGDFEVLEVFDGDVVEHVTISVVRDGETVPINDWPASHATFKRGNLVRKTKGSQWRGKVVGWYSTALTPEGYAVESSSEVGSVQIYPASALAVDNGDAYKVYVFSDTGMTRRIASGSFANFPDACRSAYKAAKSWAGWQG